ncbi:12967_t:CDS:1, partial [Rhizophagus irregularis]
IPPEPDVIFKKFLESKHGQFLETYIRNNDALPSYSPPIDLKTTVPASSKGDRPSLLLHNLSGDNSITINPITQVTTIQTAMRKAKNNLLVLLGTSGCGKTRTCYELLCENWGLYFVGARKGNGGSGDIEEIENYLWKNSKITENFEDNRRHADHVVRCLVLSRLLILDECIKSSSTFNPQRWLLLQTCQKIFGSLYNYADYLFKVLTFMLTDCTQVSLEIIDTIYDKISGSSIFPIIFDETQSLQMVLNGKFRSRYDPNEKRSLISPVIQTFKRPTPLFSGHCAVACGTGLGLLSLGETLGSLGIAKPDLDIDKFTGFGRWRDIAHVKEYVSRQIVLTDNEYDRIYKLFRGRFRPIITIVEDVIMGLSINDAIDGLWETLTHSKNGEQSLYKKLHGIIERSRPNHLLSNNVLDLYKSLTLSYYYSGSPYLCTDE